MVQNANQNMRIARRFKKELQKKLRVSKMILFGSRARGTYSDESDFDFMVVSDDFSGVAPHRRSAELYKIWDEDYPLELVCFTEEELARKRNNPWGVALEALRTGVKV